MLFVGINFISVDSPSDPESYAVVDANGHIVEVGDLCNVQAIKGLIEKHSGDIICTKDDFRLVRDFMDELKMTRRRIVGDDVVVPALNIDPTAYTENQLRAVRIALAAQLV